LLDVPGLINQTSSLPQLSCDEYYFIDEAAYQAGQPTELNAYVWNKDLFGGQVARPDWNTPNASVFYANSVITGLKGFKVSPTDQQEYNNILGQAYFVRAFNFFDLVKNFAPPYDDATAATDLGIPLKLSPNVNTLVQRSTVQQSYAQIIADLSNACRLLNPALASQNLNRASKPSAYALFARLYISMRKYPQAELYADSSLALYNTLIDYNTISQTAKTPFTKTNAESLLYSLYAGGYNVPIYNSPDNTSIDTNLLSLYSVNDLRRPIFFTAASAGLIKAKRGYSAGPNVFSGLATDEMYLIKAECAARCQDNQTSLQYLNTLLIKRYLKGTYVPYTTGNTPNALALVLKERRKELVWRAGLRWDDLRRLNKDGANITLTRVLNGKTYTLPPNSSLYTFPIPDDEIALSGIQQNIR
jgi:starch-binding outer membrane protein, SusD/RagB family